MSCSLQNHILNNKKIIYFILKVNVKIPLVKRMLTFICCDIHMREKYILLFLTLS